MTKNQATALRAMANCKACKTEALEVGIAACRSDTYKAALAKYNEERSACLDYNKRKEMMPPKTEPVPGAAELRSWLGVQYDHMWELRQKRVDKHKVLNDLPLRQRCLNRLRAHVGRAYKECAYRTSQSKWAGGNHTTEVLVGAHTVEAHGYTERTWSSNGKWSGTNSVHRIGVRLSWNREVWARGIASVDSLLTLDATPATEGLREGEEALAATWVVQGRGVGLRAEEGILYRRHGGAWVHGTSIKNARACNNNRVKSLAEMRLAAIQRKLKAKAEIASLAGLVVTREDCTQAGLCDPGQRDWLAKRGLDENLPSLPAQRLLEMAILSNDRVNCVRRAIHITQSRTAQMAA